ncbi:MAG: LamG domain-containing protein [Verrucomicrobia bacterium]|nr:LamG domain-containing protein [Verrucomicrobiota bacterium]
MFAAQSTHTVALTYPLAGGGSDTYEWKFTVGAFTRDLVQSRIGVFRGGSTFTPAGGGRTGTGSDRAVEFGNGTGPISIVQVDFLNQAAANDEMTFAIWAKKYDIANNSVFWGISPSSSSNLRGWQAHLPWSNNNIYFDTAGCCDGSTQRINAPITDFAGYSGDETWWRDWHFFVFSKKGEVKQIWIDGTLFLEGYNTAPLPTDFNELLLGAEPPAGNLFHGQIDDFSVYRTALTEAQIGQLRSGTSPQALPAAAGLLAYWNFDDMPAEGLFVSFTPEPDTLTADPNLIRVVHAEGTPAWDTSKVSLLLDGTAINATVTQASGLTTVTYVPSPILAAGSHHTATIRYPGADGTTILSRDWEFTVASYTKDVLHSYVGVLRGPAKFTADGGGRTGQAGDFGIDFGTVNNRQGVFIGDASWLNQASATDQFAVAGWQKLHNVADSAFFWAVSPSSSGTQRGVGTHTPWSNNNLYFDTAGCCDAATQRINGPITDFLGYSGDVAWWRDWHHFVFQKNAEVKQIWIDGQLFLEGYNTNPLPTDFTTAWFGYNPADNGGLQGILDDMAIYGAALTEAQVGQLAAGSSPQSLPATAKLLAYWNFNDASVPVPVLNVSYSAGNVTITWTNGGTLQQATSVTGPYTDIAGATSGTHTEAASAAQRYFRVRK